MADYGFPPVFPPEEEDTAPKEEEEVKIVDKAKGKKVCTEAFAFI